MEVKFPEWRDGNARIKYPFSDLATLVNGGGVAIDRDVFVDARLYPLGGTEELYLSRVSVASDYPSAVTVYVGTPETPLLAWAAYDPAAPPTNGELRLADAAGRTAGVLVSDADRLLAFAQAMPVGDTDFDQDQTPFAPTAIVPMPAYGVRSIVADDGGAVSGRAVLVGTDGIVLWDDGDGKIRIDVVGDPYALVNRCLADGTPVPRFCGLRTINGVGPNDQGDFVLSAGRNEAYDNVFRIVWSGDKLEIRAEGLMGLTDG